MITQVNSASFVWRCPVCYINTETNYNTLTLGNDDSVMNFALPVCSCGTYSCCHLNTDRLFIAHLAMAEIFSLAKSLASYYGAWTSTDVDMALGTYPKLSDYETIPCALNSNNGKIHWASSRTQKSIAQMIQMVKEGWIIYGTETVIRQAIEECSLKATMRSIVLKRHGYS